MKYTSGKVDNCQLFDALVLAALIHPCKLSGKIADSYNKITRKHLF